MFRKRRWVVRLWSPQALQLAALVVGWAPGLVGQGGATPPTRWILVYAGGPKRPAYSVDDYVHLLAVVDTTGRPEAWLCTGVLYLEVWAPSGRAFATFAAHRWAVGEDWSTYLDTLFRPGGNLDRLDSALTLVSKMIGGRGQPVRVTIMVPYPDPRLDTLRFGGRTYRLTSVESRLSAVAAWVDSVRQRFHDGRFRGLQLYGMYWLEEKVVGDDRAFVPEAANVVHRAGLKFLWIPYYRSTGHELWRTFGFDEAWYQPNYFFRLPADALRVDSAMQAAEGLQMGAEIEFDPRLFTDSMYANRLVPYIMSLWSHPALRRRSLAIYDGAGALLTLSRSRDPRFWGLYRRLVQAVTDTADAVPGGPTR